MHAAGERAAAVPLAHVAVGTEAVSVLDQNTGTDSAATADVTTATDSADLAEIGTETDPEPPSDGARAPVSVTVTTADKESSTDVVPAVATADASVSAELKSDSADVSTDTADRVLHVDASTDAPLAVQTADATTEAIVPSLSDMGTDALPERELKDASTAADVQLADAGTDAPIAVQSTDASTEPITVQSSDASTEPITVHSSDASTEPMINVDHLGHDLSAGATSLEHSSAPSTEEDTTRPAQGSSTVTEPSAGPAGAAALEDGAGVQTAGDSSGAPEPDASAPGTTKPAGTSSKRNKKGRK